MKQERLNPMCLNCIKLSKECKGTTNQTWTGCIYKKREEKNNGIFKCGC